MPFFGSKFSPKKTPPRKRNLNLDIEELFDENHYISLNLGGIGSNFQKGEWIPEKGKESGHKHTQRLKNRIEELQEENNMLKLKYELLLNMLTQSASENEVYKDNIQ